MAGWLRCAVALIAALSVFASNARAQDWPAGR